MGLLIARFSSPTTGICHVWPKICDRISNELQSALESTSGCRFVDCFVPAIPSSFFMFIFLNESARRYPNYSVIINGRFCDMQSCARIDVPFAFGVLRFAHPKGIINTCHALLSWLAWSQRMSWKTLAAASDKLLNYRKDVHVWCRYDS